MGQLFKRIVTVARGLLWFGTRRHCPVCGSRVRRFLHHGVTRRPDARCPVCFSLERHRLTWLVFAHKTDLFDGAPKRMLHIAPEKTFAPRLRRLAGVDYVSGDLSDPNAMVRMDVTDIPFEDCSFDVVYCSHVLEHVDDDRQAMQEMLRVLKPGAWAVLLVPIDGKTTVEGETDDPKERKRLFGQEDHVRSYGLDFGERLADAGFQVTVHTASELLPPEQQRRMGIHTDERVFFCRS